MMFKDFENALKKQYCSEAEFKQSHRIQAVIDYTGFDHDFLCEAWKKVTKSTDMYKGLLLGCKISFLPEGGVFGSTLETAAPILAHTSKLRFVCCRSQAAKNKDFDPQVIAFPKYLEQHFYNHISKLERLKAFL